MLKQMLRGLVMIGVLFSIDLTTCIQGVGTIGMAVRMAVGNSFWLPSNFPSHEAPIAYRPKWPLANTRKVKWSASTEATAISLKEMGI